MADSFGQLVSTGVSPRRAQVLPTNGTNEKPLSSIKANTALSRSAFFNPRPLLPKPLLNHPFIALRRLAPRLLPAEAQGMQQSPHMITMITHPKLLLDHRRDIGGRPETNDKTARRRAADQNFGQPLFNGRKSYFGRTSGRGG